MNRRTMLENLLSEQEPAPVIPYLTFSSPNSFSVAKTSNGYEADGTLEYSTDTTTWNIWDGSEITSVLNDGTYYVYLRGSNNTYVHGKFAHGNYRSALKLTGSNISCNGNIENLLDYQTVKNGGHPAMAENCFRALFSDCSQLIQAPQLPFTTLTNFCYERMFYNCTSLTEIVIPNSVTSIGDWAFYSCPSLTIYCEAASKPSGWNSDWNKKDYNGNYLPVVWGYTGE